MKVIIGLITLWMFILFPSFAYAFDELGDGIAELGAILFISYIISVVATILILIFNRSRNISLNYLAYFVCTIGILIPVIFCIMFPVGVLFLIMLVPILSFLFIFLNIFSQASNYKKNKVITQPHLKTTKALFRSGALMANEKKFNSNMQFLKRYFLLSFILITFSCQKNEEEEDFPIDYPNTYHCLRYENTSKIRLFAKSGEVTSSKIITRFYQKYGDDFLFKDNFSYRPVRPDSIHLLSSNTAFFNEWKHVLDKKKEVLLLIPKDTLMANLPIEYDFDLIMSIGKQKPIYQKVIQVNANFGTYNLYKNLSNKLAYIKPNNQLEMPLLHYVLLHNSTSDKWAIKQRLYNQFDSSATLQIRSSDTLAIQEFRLLFEK